MGLHSNAVLPKPSRQSPLSTPNCTLHPETLPPPLRAPPSGIYSQLGGALLSRLDDVPPPSLASAAVAISRGGCRDPRFFIGLLQEATQHPSRFTTQQVQKNGPLLAIENHTLCCMYQYIY